LGGFGQQGIGDGGYGGDSAIVVQTASRALIKRNSSAPEVRNLPELTTMPSYGHKLVQALKDLRTMIRNVAQQTNAFPVAQEMSAPPQINALSVTASGGVAHVQIIDNNPIYRGTTYHVQYATDPGFSAPCNHYMGPSRDARIPVGTQPLYYRAFSDVPTSGASAPVYHGGAIPRAVAATGSTPPPIPAGQGSGTGFAGQISGHGPIPFRGATPPRRS
jgi:hypothetical protein